MLSAAAPASDDFDDDSTNDDFLKAVTYKQLASIAKQSERVSGTSLPAYTHTQTTSSAGVMTRG